jgi:hypothetical protein
MENIWKKLRETGSQNIYLRSELKQLAEKLEIEQNIKASDNIAELKCCGPNCTLNFVMDLNISFYHDSSKGYAIYCSFCYDKRNFDKNLEQPLTCDHAFFLSESKDSDCCKMTVHKGSYQLLDDINLCLNHWKMIQNLVIQMRSNQISNKNKKKKKKQRSKVFNESLKEIEESLKYGKLVKLEFKMLKKNSTEFSIYWNDIYTIEYFLLSTEPRVLTFPNEFIKLDGWIQKLEKVSTSWFIEANHNNNVEEMSSEKNNKRFNLQEMKLNREKFNAPPPPNLKYSDFIKPRRTVYTIWDHISGDYGRLPFNDMLANFGSIRSWLPFEYQEFKFGSSDGDQINGFHELKKLYPKFFQKIEQIQDWAMNYDSYIYPKDASIQIWLLVNCDIDSGMYGKIILALLPISFRSQSSFNALNLYDLNLTPLQFSQLQLKPWTLLNTFMKSDHELFLGKYCHLIHLINSYYIELKLENMLEELSLYIKHSY